MLHHYRAEANTDGITIETYLLKVAGLSPRTALKKAFTTRQIRINGRVVDRQQIVHTGDTIEIDAKATGLHARSEATITANPELPLIVLLETPSWIAIAKPAGQNAHPLHPEESQTSLNGLVARYPETAISCRPDKPLEGQLVHRLDRGTSGILLCARNQATFDLCRKQWGSPAMEKIYLAWVTGYLTEGRRLDLRLDHDPKSNRRMIAVDNPEKGRHAVTSFIPIKTVTLANHEPVTLVLIRLHTGVMHQIRASFKAIGHPVLCDPIYLQKTAVPSPERFKPQPLDRDTYHLLEELRLRVVTLAEPDPESVPEQGFFLHALWLRVPGIPLLEGGILAPVPKYFG